MMMTCNCQHRVTDIQLSPAWNPDSHPPQGISLAGIRFVKCHAVFENFLQNCVFIPPCSVDTPASGKSWIPNCICWTLRFKHGTGVCSFCWNFSERQILWSLCLVDFHTLTLQLPIQTPHSVAPELQVFVSSLQNSQNFRKTSTTLVR